MIAAETQNQIIGKLEELIGARIVDVKIPGQGMDSEVLLVTDINGKEYAVKYHRKGASSDGFVLRFLEEKKVNIPVPKVLGDFVIEGRSVLILEKINFPLLETVPISEMHRYIPSMIGNLRKIHQVTSGKAGSLNEIGEKRSWKKIMLAKFNGADPVLNWKKIVERQELDSKLILMSVENIIKKIEGTEFAESEYSFLHTDFNQRNLFVNPNSDEITGIIDWGEAMFGDPVYDFARVRMLIWHFNLGDKALKDYYDLVSFTQEQKKLEELYWLIRVIEYLAYYSEELNEFNVRIIKLHEDFLRNIIRSR